MQAPQNPPSIPPIQCLADATPTVLTNFDFKIKSSLLPFFFQIMKIKSKICGLQYSLSFPSGFFGHFSVGFLIFWTVLYWVWEFGVRWESSQYSCEFCHYFCTILMKTTQWCTTLAWMSNCTMEEQHNSLLHEKIRRTERRNYLYF